MKKHHQIAINNLVKWFQDDSVIQAIILTGSVAKGIARDDSDIDCYLIMTDEEFTRRQKLNELFYYNDTICEYPGGYIDGKIIPYRYLEIAVEQGSEPTRASFLNAQVVFSRVDGVEALIAQITQYPEKNRQKNLTDFYAQVLLYGNYFAIKAIEQNNPYLLSQSLSNVVLFASRMILAHNRILFPCHKSLMRVVKDASDKPADYDQLVNELLAEPTKDRITAFVELISSFQDWGLSSDQAVSLFIENNEWNWLDAPPPLQDR
jgi:predicted nucleotidyltransferase